MRALIPLFVLVALAIGVATVVDFDATARWAAQHQRDFQNHMAGAVQSLRAGEPGALLTLCTATAAYGFFHAVGPGHGKALIGGVGLGAKVSIARLLSISVISSLLQSLWAIVLVFGGFALLEISAHQMTGLAEDYLAPASYLMIALIGVLLMWRGVRTFWKSSHQSDGHHHHSHGQCCGHSHGPAPDEIAQLSSLWDTVGMIASIAIRPCTGAIFLLVIAWQMDLKLAGILAVLVMGLGTACFTSFVAVSSISARALALTTSHRFGAINALLPGLQILAGGLIVWLCLTLFINAI